MRDPNPSAGLPSALHELLLPAHQYVYRGKVMTMKVVFEKETYRLLGAQIIGYEGVDKRIDVLATAIPCRAEGNPAEGFGSRICTALFLCQGSCKYGRIHDRQYSKRYLKTMASGRYGLRFLKVKSVVLLM